MFLGTGTSVGVPFIGCGCAVCTSSDPLNRRLRSSLWLKDDNRSVLIDCGPDFRAQALRAGLTWLDAVILTHEHYDHIFGLDDLRQVRHPHDTERGLPIWGDEATIACVRRVFAYVFDGCDTGSAKPRLDLRELTDLDQPFNIAGLSFLPVPVHHGTFQVIGVRVGDLAYIPDCKQIPEASLERLTGLDTLILDGLRRTPHNTHLHLDAALELAQKIGARQTYLTHLTHDYDQTCGDEGLPAGVHLAYDGLELEVTGIGSSASASCAPAAE